MCFDIDWIKFWSKGASLAAILTLLFAVVTYWIDQIFKLKRKNQLKRSVITELRSVYSTIRSDIINYDGLVTENYSFKIPFPYYAISIPYCNYFVSAAKVHEITKNKTVEVNIIQIVSTVKSFEEYIKEHRINPPKTIHEKANTSQFMFEHRLAVLRDNILDISEQKDFFSMDIVPANQYKNYKILMRWYEKAKVRKKDRKKLTKQMIGFQVKYGEVFLMEKRSIEILRRFLPDKIFREVNISDKLYIPFRSKLYSPNRD